MQKYGPRTSLNCFTGKKRTKLNRSNRCKNFYNSRAIIHPHHFLVTSYWVKFDQFGKNLIKHAEE